MAEDNNLKKGSLCVITTVGKKDEPLVTEGKFVGYVSLSGVPALIVETKGKKKSDDIRRIVPIHMILSIDVMEEGEDDEEPGENVPGLYT